MRAMYSIFFLLVFFSCSLTKNTTTANDCIENKEFKEKFFTSIQKVEDYVLGKGNRKSFTSSLKFISKHTHVSYDKMLNYNNSYTRTEDFEIDKKNWLDWYEKNKCLNFKKNYN